MGFPGLVCRGLYFLHAGLRGGRLFGDVVGGGVDGVEVLAGHLDGERLTGGVAIGSFECAAKGGKGYAFPLGVHPAYAGGPLPLFGKAP